jgi:hypothetical protein
MGSILIAKYLQMILTRSELILKYFGTFVKKFAFPQKTVL